MFLPKPSCAVVALFGLNKGSAHLHSWPNSKGLHFQHASKTFGENLCYLTLRGRNQGIIALIQIG